MAVAFDASSEFATFTTTSPATATHTPSGTPAGIIVAIAHASTSADLITGVTYGGVTMERVGTAIDASGEVGHSYLYFLGEGIPTGAQTVSITHTGSSDVKWASTASVTASGDTEAGTGVWRNQNDTNPTCLVFKGITGMVFGVAYSGLNAIGSLVPLAGMTHIHDVDFSGVQVASFDYETSPSAVSFNFGYTASSDDSAICTINVIEKVAGIRPLGCAVDETTANTTTLSILPGGTLDGQNLYAFAISRDHTSGTAQATCTDNSGANTWNLVSNDTDRKINVWWKLGNAADVGCAITIAGCVGSSQGGIVAVAGADTSGDPTNNLTVETNASGDETHAAITPDLADSLIFFSVADYGNDTNPATSIACTDPGSLEPEIFDRLSSGGLDCRINVTARAQSGGPTSTGDFTWSQTNSTTKSVAFAVSPGVAPVTGTGSSTLDDVTSAGTGSESMLATGASTLDGATSDGTGTIVNPVSGTGASTLDGVTSLGTGTETILGTGSSTLNGVTSAGSGIVANPVSGTGSSTLAGVASSGTGTLGYPASGSSPLDGVTSAGSGAVANPVSGTGSSTLDGVTSLGVGAVSSAGHIESVVCDLLGPSGECDTLGPAGTCTTLGPLGECDDLGPSGDCDSIGPLCVGSISV